MVYCKVLDYFSLLLNSEIYFQYECTEELFVFPFIFNTKSIDFQTIPQQKNLTFSGTSCPLTSVEISYYGVVFSINHESSNGDQDIVITGLVV